MPDGPDRKERGRRRLRVIIAAAFLLLVAVAVFIYLSKPESPWAPTTMEYGDCNDDCIDLGVRNFAHMGDVHFYYDKDVDDAVVQWATCLESAISCIKEGSKEDTTLITKCVAASACPTSCRGDYADRVTATSDLKEQLDYFQQTFLKEGSLCRPVEE